MYSAQRNAAIRWAVVICLFLLMIYTWRNPRHSRSARITEALAEVPAAHAPSKIYDADLGNPRQKILGEVKHDAMDKVQENPKAPSFPAFRTSSNDLNRTAYNPYPAYNSRSWRKKWKGSYAACRGPRGGDITGEDVTSTAFVIDENHPIPQPMFGSYEETGIDSDFCFDRFARFSPYGLEDETVELTANSPLDIEWRHVRWGRLQNECLERNHDRFTPIERTNNTSLWMPTQDDFAQVDDVLYFPSEQRKGLLSKGASYKKRSAVVIHMQASTEYTVDTTEYIRSLITELSLHSGAEYEVIFMVEAKWSHLEAYEEDIHHSIFDSASSYRLSLTKVLPEEFRENAVLYTPALLKAWYAKITSQPNENTPNTQPMQALQLLSLLRPDIEHFWQLEHDARYSGHHYQLLETMSAWSRAQPRRGLWERNARYFMPAVHESWATYTEKIENASIKADIPGVWGPVRAKNIEPIGPDPLSPTPEQDRNHEWGVGEEADLITAAPIIDVTGSGPKGDLVNYPQGTKTPQRMTTLGMMTRYSKRLLRAMHHGQITLGTSMPMDRYPASTVLHHGLKAVAFPLPTYLDYAKVAKSIEKEYNYRDFRKSEELNKLGKTAKSKKEGSEAEKQPKTPLEQARKFEEIGNRMSFFELGSGNKDSCFADELYKRWLGYGKDPTEKLCLPGIMLHPIRGV